MGSALLASQARQKVGKQEDADQWAWDRLPKGARALFNPKGERLDRKPNWEIIESWRRRVREKSIKAGEDFYTAQSRFDLAGAVRKIRELRTPPSPASQWEEAAELIIRGKLTLWKPASPLNLAVSGRPSAKPNGKVVRAASIGKRPRSMVTSFIMPRGVVPSARRPQDGN